MEMVAPHATTCRPSPRRQCGEQMVRELGIALENANAPGPNCGSSPSRQQAAPTVRSVARRCLRLELCSPGASGLNVGLIIDTAQAEARRDSIAGAEPL